ncbi:alpha/beta hydrolase [Leptospira yanagawae]|uniref:Alpha/beta hydrolase n=1 Tax=Leptospira yanagawae TaxID=293069 RepID=A0ABY2M5G8_9LEPT|nr:alpha/beta hydrolase [Leptospira yanagawae]TGL24461.1 alpha/beta hydrolase [Leptospira yanagawae]
MKFLLSILLIFTFCSSPAKENLTSHKSNKIGTSKTIVFVHGMYMTPKSWETWITFFKLKGFKVHAPAYPLHDLDPEILRKKYPNPELTKLTFAQVKEHYKQFILSLDEKPILIGHSMGGLVVQSLLNERIGSSAIALSPAPPKGIVSKLTAMKHGFSFVTSSWPVINPFVSDDSLIFLDEEHFIEKFANGLELEEAKNSYQQFVVPESRRLPRSILTEQGEINFDKERGPLLLIAADEDHIIPNTLVRDNHKAYSESAGITDFIEYKGKGHLLHRQKGWENIANDCLSWIEANR